MSFFKKLFDIRSSADPEKAIAAITEGVPIRGYNMWLLICSVILASIGLDTSSSAVIIGAMLISPLMSPILGIGLSFGIHDKTLLVYSLKNFSYAVLLSLIASVLYFSVSPFANVTPELESRTYPTLLDVLVALFGGIAGIVSATRSGASTAIPGVAIATALMPPLCTAGYGLATRNWAYFGGAFYLFFINAVFISLATYWVVRHVHFPRKAFVSRRQKKYYLLIYFALIVAVTIPSIYFLYSLYEKRSVQIKLKELVIDPIGAQGNEILKWELLNKDSVIWVKVYHSGNSLSDSLKGVIEESLDNNDLESYELKSVRVNMTKDEINQLSADVSRQMFQQLQIEAAGIEQRRKSLDSLPVKQLEQELKAAFPFIGSISGGLYFFQALDQTQDTIPMIIWKPTSARISEKNLQSVKQFLKTRLVSDSILLIQQ